MIRFTLTALTVCLLPVAVRADEKTPAPAAEPGKEAPKDAASLPADVQNFYGKVTGTVVSVDLGKSEMKVKVTSAEADAEKNKAPKPAALAGMTIVVTPLAVKKDDTVALDEAAVAYIKGAKAGDAVTIPVRASSKGVVFRLLKVPSAAGK